MATIQEDIDKSSEWIAMALTSSRYRPDFTPESLWEIDRFFDEHSLGGGREAGGEWRGNDHDPDAEVLVELHLPDGTSAGQYSVP